MSIDRWMDKEDVGHIHNEILANRKNKIMLFAATWMNLEITILSYISQTIATWYHLYVESKIRHKWTYLQNRNRPTDTENRLEVTQGEDRGRGKDWEFGISRCKLVYTEQINKILLYCTGNYIQYPVINHNGEEYT